MDKNLRKYFLLVKFFTHDLRFSGQSTVFMFTLILVQLTFVFQGTESIKETFLTSSFILLTLVVIQAFDFCLEQDIKDGSLEWILSQRLSQFHYFLARSLAFTGVVVLPLVVFTLGLWCWQQNTYSAAFSLFFGLMFGGTQMILLAGSFSLSLLFRQQNFHLSLPLCLLPLQLPVLIILHALEIQRISSLSALCILGGLCLLAGSIARMIVKEALSF